MWMIWPFVFWLTRAKMKNHKFIRATCTPQLWDRAGPLSLSLLLSPILSLSPPITKLQVNLITTGKKHRWTAFTWGSSASYLKHNCVSTDSELVTPWLWTQPNILYNNLEAASLHMSQPQTRRFSLTLHDRKSLAFLPQVRLRSPAEASQQESGVSIMC